MVCPPKRIHNSATEVPVFHIYTSNQQRKSVGIKLINLIKRDICYEHRPQSAHSRTGHMETLFWNDGEPDYERIGRKGITKNWRTGEDLNYQELEDRRGPVSYCVAIAVAIYSHDVISKCYYYIFC